MARPGSYRATFSKLIQTNDCQIPYHYHQHVVCSLDYLCSRALLLLGGWILLLRADKTTALSWLLWSTQHIPKISSLTFSHSNDSSGPLSRLKDNQLPHPRKGEGHSSLFVSCPMSGTQTWESFMQQCSNLRIALPIACCCCYFAQIRHCFQPTTARW